MTLSACHDPAATLLLLHSSQHATVLSMPQFSACHDPLSSLCQHRNLYLHFTEQFTAPHDASCIRIPAHARPVQGAKNVHHAAQQHLPFHTPQCTTVLPCLCLHEQAPSCCNSSRARQPCCNARPQMFLRSAACGHPFPATCSLSRGHIVLSRGHIATCTQKCTATCTQQRPHCPTLP